MNKSSLFCSLTTLLLAISLQNFACSICKVTINEHTYLGNNEDNWRLGSKIWFENKTFGKFGAVYVGFENFPQGGMNEAGLAFDGVTIIGKNITIDLSKKTVTNPAKFIKDIMQTCQSVENVMRYMNQFNRPFSGGVLMFADKFGKYLIIEPDTMFIGNDDKYIIANFCPSSATTNEKIKFERYKRGNDFLLKHTNDISETYCLALVDTMHECREKIGDGTLYSFIADLEKVKFNLSFYHDYGHLKTFDLKEELAKGDHAFEIPDLFPPNAEYQKLISFKTPQNNVFLKFFLFACGVLFIFSAIFFFINYLRNDKSNAQIKLFLSIISLVLLYYVIVLIKTQAIFYFPSPYQDVNFSMLNIAAYIPFLMLILIIPLVMRNIKIFQDATWKTFPKYLFTLNNLTYFALIILFAYWKFYDVF